MPTLNVGNMAHEVGGVSSWARFNTALAANILREAAAAATQPLGEVLAPTPPTICPSQCANHSAWSPRSLRGTPR